MLTWSLTQFPQEAARAIAKLTVSDEDFNRAQTAHRAAGIATRPQSREMVFLTNNLEWSAQTIADLYRCRWSFEVFFKELTITGL